MFDKDRSEDVFKPVRFVGIWWIPGNERKIHGELNFSTTDGGTLKLAGKLPSAPSELEVVHGETLDKKRITIFNSFTIGLSCQSGPNGIICQQTLEVHDMWIGPFCFKSKYDVILQNYSFGIHNLENWADLNCFSGDIVESLPGMTLTYKKPDPILLFEDDKCSISLSSTCSDLSSSRGQIEGSIAHFPRILIRARNGRLAYYGETDSISQHEWMIFVLIALLMGVPTWQFGFGGKVPPCGEGEYSDSEISFRHCYTKNIEDTGQSRKPTCFELLFPFDTIASKFQNMAKAFSKLFRDNESQIGVLFQFLCKKKKFEASTLPNLLFAFEELEKNLFAENNAPLEKEEQMWTERIQNQLKPCCQESDWDWVLSKLRWQGLSFKQRMRIAFEEMRSIYPGLDGNVETRLLSYLSKTRNNFAHAAKPTSDDYFLYVCATDWLAEFMTLMLWRSCGLTQDQIKSIYFRKLGPECGQTNQLFQRLAH